ncbi:MAG: hypothetical protein JKX84_07625, partial [Flavobacteriales bacterium]|nr:hypothetical protein [Flavobacteriales bacterium]
MFRYILMASLLGVAFFSFAQQPIQLIVQHNEAMLSKKKLAKAKRLKEFYPDSNTVVEELSDLTAALQELGFAEAGIDSISWKKDTTIAHLHIGPRYVFSNVGAGNVPKGVLRKVGFKPELYANKNLRPNQLSNLKKRILQFYENKGFPFAVMNLDSLQLDSNKLNAVLHLEKNQEFRIDSIIVRGTARIRSKYLQNYLGIKRNDRYNESRMNPISTRIKEIAFVTEKKPPEVIFGEDKAKLYLYLDKKRASQFDGILGVLPSSENPGKVLITGELKVKLLSAFRRGELIDL